MWKTLYLPIVINNSSHILGNLRIVHYTSYIFFYISYMHLILATFYVHSCIIGRFIYLSVLCRRISRSTFEYILTIIAPRLMRTYAGLPMISPEKQFLIAIWRMATPDSYR
jgi:hypothetical protein